MNTKTINLTFLTEIGKKVSLRIPNAKEDVSKEEIDILMDKFISTGVLLFDGAKLVEKVSAKIIDQSVDVIKYKA